MTFIMTSDGSIPLSKLEQIAEREKGTLWPNPPIFDEKMSPKNHTVLFSSEITDEKMKSWLQFPFSGLVDANAQKDSISRFLSDEVEKDRSLSVLITCPFIYNCDIALSFSKALQRRLSLSQQKFMGIHMAVHEALVNGLIHGNLELGSEYRQSSKTFIEYGALLEKRLKDPAYAKKSILIKASWSEHHLKIKIKDEGAGYIISDTFRSTSGGKSGRGLMIIAGIADSCTIDDFGREMNLTFSLNQEEKKSAVYTSFEPRSAPDLSSCRVLIMEDNKSNQTMLQRLLRVIGIREIMPAYDGLEGLQKVKEFQPDLIILDITMPRLDGYEVLSMLRTEPDTRDIPVLIETASDTREARDKTFSAGATDFITKPINPLEFFSRVKVHLENKLLISRLEEQLKNIQQELQTAHKMQEDLLPKPELVEKIKKDYRLNIASFFQSSSEIGGDAYDFLPLSSHKLAFYICDFSGHGVSAALNTFRLDTLIHQMDKSLFEKPDLAMSFLNNQFVRLLPRGQFATFLLGVIDTKKEQIKYAASGVPNPFFWNAEGEEHLLETSGLPLGIRRDTVYEVMKLPFTAGTKLMLFSDSFVESPLVNNMEQRIGTEGLKRILDEALQKKTPTEIVSTISRKFLALTPKKLFDDATLIFMEKY